MTNRRQAIVDLVRVVAEALGNDLDKFVFVGGAAAALLTDNPTAGDVRPTDDVDLVADIDTYGQYARLIDLLRNKHGFSHDMNGPLCRFTVRGVTVDVMPSSEEVLRFANKWYKHAVASWIPYTLPTGDVIKLISPPVFLCTKLEAFADRGKDDYCGSDDLEDIITLVDGRDSLVAECKASPADLISYLSRSLQRLLHQQQFLDSLEWLLPLGSQSRLDLVKERLSTLAGLK